MKNFRSKRQQGSFLIDLMIGLFMSTLTVLGIMTIYAQFEVQKRTTVQLGTTISNASIAMFPLQHYAKMAGYGIVNSNILGCTIKGYNKDSNQDLSFVLSPVAITAGTEATDSDQVSFIFGNPEQPMMPNKLLSNTSASNEDIQIQNTLGIQPGDLVVLYESGKNCNLAQVSSVNTSNNTLVRGTGSYTDSSGKAVSIKYNKDTGLVGGVNYTTNGMLLDIGKFPEFITYSISNKQLKETNILTSKTTVIADNIVLLKARYGLDTDKNGQIDSWTNNIGTATNYKFLKAIKLAIIARTPLKEQPVNGVCKTTTNGVFNWGNETIDITGITEDWQCYRYRFIQSIVPLRNIMWSA